MNSRNRVRVPNNSERILRRIQNLNLDGIIRYWSDDGNIGVVVRDNELQNVVSQLQSLDLPMVGDGVQEGSVFVSNESGSVNEELYEL